METIAEQFAAYTHTLRFEELPEGVIHEVTRRIIDSLGCAFGASLSEPGRISRSIAQQVSSPSGATVLGTSHKTSPDLAAFANGTLIRYLDYNDTYLSQEPAHPSDNISTALAVAEAGHSNGRQIITAIVIGYEVQCRLCDAASLRKRGWDHVTYGPFSSSLVAAKLLGLSEEQIVHAIGLAGVSNIALRQTRVGEISMWKASAFANAARNGVFAALLAREGMTGPSPIFEGGKGFWKLVSGPFELEPPGGRGGSFKILETSLKYFPAEYHAQSAIESALILRKEIVQEEGIDAIESIEVRTFDVAVEIIAGEREKWHPRTRETADHSLPYCIAVALMDGEVGLAQFSEERIADPRLHDLIQRIQVTADPDLTKEYPEAVPTRVEIRTRSGRSYSRKVTFPRGHPKNPMTDQEVEAKFSLLTEDLLSREQRARILDRLWHLEEIDDIGRLMPLCVLSHP